MSFHIIDENSGMFNKSAFSRFVSLLLNFVTIDRPPSLTLFCTTTQPLHLAENARFVQIQDEVKIRAIIDLLASLKYSTNWLKKVVDRKRAAG